MGSIYIRVDCKVQVTVTAWLEWDVTVTGSHFGAVALWRFYTIAGSVCPFPQGHWNTTVNLYPAEVPSITNSFFGHILPIFAAGNVGIVYRACNKSDG